jgi:acyl-CoA synthetase (NDP forming)/RimJ/RimL family protein N-acetyltransferase
VPEPADPSTSIATSPSGGYPAHWEADVVLSDGGTMHVRPIRPDDGERLEAFHARQSPESIYFRYFSPRPRLTPRDIERLTHLDYADRMAFVGLIGDELVGIARYDRLPTQSVAEVAFFTDDRHAGRGMATVLLEYLAAAAREVGIAGFTATVLPNNRKMLGVFHQVGFETKSRFADGVIEVELGIEPTPEALAKIEERARLAYARSVRRILRPHSIAVVGASRTPGTIGNELVRRIVLGGFHGPVYPVNPHASYVASVRAHRTVSDVPDEVDVAVICVPAEAVLDVVRDCARKRVQGLVVISAGFAETGPAGADLERQVVELAHRHGMRLVGPNSMGFVNTDPDVQLGATYLGHLPKRGRIGFSSQSGTLGAAVLSHLRQLDLGISTFVSVGNRPDVSGNDLLQYWEDDPETDLVLLYLENFGNPRNFARICRRMCRSKPVIAVKSGRGMSRGPGAREAATDDDWPAEASIDAMLRQTGVIRVDTLEQLFDVTRVLTHQPVPNGRRVALISNSWGPAVLAADACVGAGLQLADLAPETSARMRARVEGLSGGPANRAANPVDLGYAAGPDDFQAAVAAVLDDPGVDAVLVVHAPPVPEGSEAVHAALADVAATGDIPVVATFLALGERLVQHPVRCLPVFEFPEAAAQALGRVAAYGQWRAQDPGAVPEYDDVDHDAVQRLVDRALADAPAGAWLDAATARAVLDAAGVAGVRQTAVRGADEAVAAAAEVGYPIALKATGLPRLAKTEAGGVAIDVHDDDEVRQAFGRMVELLGTAMEPALVQQMAPPGVDCLVEVHQHPSLGAVIRFGLGGVSARGLDTAMQVLPLTDADARRLVAMSPVAALIAEQGPQAAAAMAEALLRVAAIAQERPELAVIRCNPVIVSGEGAFVTDARVRVAPWRVPRDPVSPYRRLEAQPLPET